MNSFFRVAPLPTVSVITTVGFIGVLLFFLARSVLAISGGKTPDNLDLLGAVALTVITTYSWLRSVKGYRLEGDQIVIDRTGPGKLHIGITSINSVELQPDLGAFVNTGLLSTGGLFGWAGKVNVRKPTDIKSLQAEVYGTNPSKMVVLRLPNERRVILTPADAAGFTQALRDAGVAEQPHAPAQASSGARNSNRKRGS